MKNGKLLKGEEEFDVDDYKEAFYFLTLKEQLADQGFYINVQKRLSSYVSVPDKSVDTGLGGKTIGDLIEDVETSRSGDTIKFSGTVKNVTEPWTDYDPSDNIGHFVPIQLPKDLVGKTIKSTGITPQRDVVLDEDCLIIVKMEHVDNLVFTLTLEDGTVIGTFDLTGLVPTGKDAFNSELSDFESNGTKDQYVEDFDMGWIGIRGSTQDGSILRKHKTLGEVTEGNHLPITLSDFFFDGIPKQVGSDDMKSETAQNIFYSVTEDNKSKLIKVVYQQLTVMEISISNVKLGPLVGKDAVSIPENGSSMDDQLEDVSVLFSRRPTIKWEGTKGTISGELKWYKFTNGHFSEKPEGHFMPFVIKHHDGETIKVTGSDGSETSLVDPKWTIRVDDYVKDGKNTTCKMYANDDLIAELDFSKLKLNLPNGEAAFTTEQNHGGYGDPSDMYEGVVRTWDRTKCVVTGKLKKLYKAQHPSVKDDPSYYFGFTLVDAFKGQTIIVEGPSHYEVEQKNATDMDYVVQIKPENKEEAIYVYGNNILTAAFDLSNIEFEE